MLKNDFSNIVGSAEQRNGWSIDAICAVPDSPGRLPGAIVLAYDPARSEYITTMAVEYEPRNWGFTWTHYHGKCLPNALEDYVSRCTRGY